MNKIIRDRLNGFYKGLSAFFSNFMLSCTSVLRVCVLSSFKVANQSRIYSKLKGNKNCCVLGNGPSLKDDFEAGRVCAEGKDVFCVNMFCSSPLFWELKPKFYYLADGIFFVPENEREKQVVRDLTAYLNKVNWEMYLVIYSSAVLGGPLFRNLKNENIKVLEMNSTEVGGFKGFRHWMYRHRLGMPRCQTVVNFALCAAINMDYENVYLYGADHTWTRDLFVNNNNEVCFGDRHLYNKNLTVVKKNCNFATLLNDFSNMFKSHYLLEEYSKSVGVKIWNCSSDSFLDSYERKLF